MEYLPGESQSKKHSSSRPSGSPSRRNAITPPAPVPAPFPGTGSGGGFSRARGDDDGPGGISYIQVFPDLTPAQTNPFTTTTTIINPHQAQPQPQQQDSSFDPPPELLTPPAGPAPPSPSFDDHYDYEYTDPVVVPDSITQHLTTTSFSALTTHLNTSYLTPALAHVRSAYIDPYLVRPAASYLASSGGAMPDLISVALLLVILFLSLKVLDYARRVVMFWVGLAWWLLWWATIIGVGVWLYTSGVEHAARDVGWLVGLARGFLGRVFEDMERAGRQQQQQQQGGRVFGGNNAGFGAGARGQQVPLGRY